MGVKQRSWMRRLLDTRSSMYVSKQTTYETVSRRAVVHRFSQVASAHKAASEVLRPEMRRGWPKPEFAPVISHTRVV
jgi:hypothetical protein